MKDNVFGNDLIYGISFDTQSTPSRIEATVVKLGVFFMKAEDTIRIDLVDNPLYEQLEAYVHANPSPARAARLHKDSKSSDEDNDSSDG